MKKVLFLLALLISTNIAMAQTWAAGTGLGGADSHTYSVNNSVSGNSIELSPEFGYIFGDQPNNNFFRANVDCNCAEIRTSSGFSFYFLQGLSHNVELTIQNKDITVAGLDDVPYMTTLTASGNPLTLFYTFSVPSGKTISVVQSNDPSTSKVSGSSIAGTTLTVYVDFATAGSGNLHFSAFLK